MPYLGSAPKSGFISNAKERYTGITTAYVDLSQSIASLADVIVWVNFVKQDSTNLTLTSSTRITLGATLVSSDIVEVAYLGKAVATQTPGTATVTNDMLAGSIALDKLSATGTKSSSTFLRGDNTFATAGGDADNYFATSGLSTKDLGVGLHIKSADSGASVDGNADELVVEGSGQSGITICSGASDKGNIFFADSGSTAQGKIIYNHSTNTLRFDSNGSEAMRIESDGDLIQGTNSAGSDGRNLRLGSAMMSYRSGTADAYHLVFFNANGEIGRIRTSGTTTAYNTSSDYRLKENEVAISDGITRLKQLKPYRFNFKTDADTTVDGFFAHEVSNIVPEAIDGDKDATNEDGSIKPQAIDQSKLVPLLTSALQEAITKIETLEARVQALENE